MVASSFDQIDPIRHERNFMKLLIFVMALLPLTLYAQTPSPTGGYGKPEGLEKDIATALQANLLLCDHKNQSITTIVDVFSVFQNYALAAQLQKSEEPTPCPLPASIVYQCLITQNLISPKASEFSVENREESLKFLIEVRKLSPDDAEAYLNYFRQIGEQKP